MYANSKVKLIMLTAELQRRLHATGSTTDVFSVHPGDIAHLWLWSLLMMHEAMVKDASLCSFKSVLGDLSMASWSHLLLTINASNSVAAGRAKQLLEEHLHILCCFRLQLSCSSTIAGQMPPSGLGMILRLTVSVSHTPYAL